MPLINPPLIGALLIDPVPPCPVNHTPSGCFRICAGRSLTSFRLARMRFRRTAGEKEDIVLKCRDMAELVTPYLEGAMGPRSRFAVRLHLLLCEACRHYVDQVRRTIRFLGGGPPPAPPESESEIMALLDSAQRDR